MADPVADGVYTIGLPFPAGSITDVGAGQNLRLLPHGQLGPDADKINVIYKPEKGAYSLQFVQSKKYLTWVGELEMNTKLVNGDKPRYFKITKHGYETDKYMISAAEDKEFHVGPSLERRFPSWVALLSIPVRTVWTFKKA